MRNSRARQNKGEAWSKFLELHASLHARSIGLTPLPLSAITIHKISTMALVSAAWFLVFAIQAWRAQSAATAPVSNTTESCTGCAAGKYMDSTSSPLVCVDCPTGKFSAVESSATCTGCSAGQYASTTKALQCTACANGKYLAAWSSDDSNNAAADCQTQPAGHFIPPHSAGDSALCGKFQSRQIFNSPGLWPMVCGIQCLFARPLGLLIS